MYFPTYRYLHRVAINLIERLKIKNIKKYVSCNERVKMKLFDDVLNGYFPVSREVNTRDKGRSQGRVFLGRHSHSHIGDNDVIIG